MHSSLATGIWNLRLLGLREKTSSVNHNTTSAAARATTNGRHDLRLSGFIKPGCLQHPSYCS